MGLIRRARDGRRCGRNPPTMYTRMFCSVATVLEEPS